VTGLLADDIRVPRYRTPPARRSKRAIHTQTARSRTHTGAHPEFGGNAVVPLLRRRPVSATSNAAKLLSAPAAAPTQPRASTSTPAYGARYCDPTPPNANVCWKSATTSSPGSPKPGNMAGSAKSTACKSASTAPAKNSPNSTKSAHPQQVSTSACPASGNSPDAPTDRTRPPNRPDPPSAENKRGFGFHPLGSWVDHGPDGTGEPLAMMLREGRAGSNTAADHIQLTKDALRQLPFAHRGGRIGRKV